MDRVTILRTTRPRVTTWLEDDLGDLLAVHSDPEVMKYPGNGVPETRERAQARLDQYLREQRELGWTKWRVEDAGGVMVGRGGFSPFREGRELGYTFARAFWGRGLATELAAAMVGWHRRHPLNSGVSLVAFAVEDNWASRRVLEKSGFSFADVRDHDGQPCAFYELPSKPVG